MSVNQWHQYELVTKMLNEQYGPLQKISEADYNKKLESGSHIGHNINNEYAVYFFFEKSYVIQSLTTFSKLIEQSFGKNYQYVILFIPHTLSPSITKFIEAKNEHRPGCIVIKRLEHFNIEPGRGPHCGIHEIMTPTEIENEITKHHKLSILDLKRIAQNDAQLQFLRVKIGDVIRITKISRSGGQSIDYRVVIKPMEKGEAIKSTQQKEESDEEESDEEESDAGSNEETEIDEEEPSDEEVFSDEE